jgi:hypothetical protein
MANNASARYLMYTFPLSTVAVTKSFTNVINIGNAVRWQSAHVAVEILGCSIFEGSKLHESNGRVLEGVRGRAGTRKREGSICAWTRKTSEVMAYLKVLNHFVTLVKCVLNITWRPASLTSSLEIRPHKNLRFQVKMAAYIVVNDQQNASRCQRILLMYSKFTPNMFRQMVAIFRGRRCLRSYSSNVCILGVCVLQSVYAHNTDTIE